MKGFYQKQRALKDGLHVAQMYNKNMVGKFKVRAVLPSFPYSCVSACELACVCACACGLGCVRTFV